MMGLPRVEHIMVVRYWVESAFRAVGFLLIVWGVVVTVQLVVAVVSAAMMRMNVGSVEILFVHGDGLLWILLGVALMRTARRIARLLVRMPSRQCPHCDYSLVGVRGAQCPECGMAIPTSSQPGESTQSANVP